MARGKPYRTYLPERWTFYRLLVRPPLTVAFPSASFTVTLRSVEFASHRHELAAYCAADASEPVIGPRYLSSDWLLEAVFHAGIPVQAATVGDTIMRRLVKEGRAEIVPSHTRRLENIPPHEPGPERTRRGP